MKLLRMSNLNYKNLALKANGLLLVLLILLMGTSLASTANDPQPRAESVVSSEQPQSQATPPPVQPAPNPSQAQVQPVPAEQQPPQQQPPSQPVQAQPVDSQPPPPPPASQATNPVREQTGQLSATTESPHRLSTIVPEKDFNKDILDYGDQFLADLQFTLPAELQSNASAVPANQLEYTKSIVNTYHDHEQLYGYLLQLNKAYPAVTRLYDIGFSEERRKLWVFEISEFPGEHRPLKPEFRYIANMHGNEVVGRELLLHLARLILENYSAAEIMPNKPTGQSFIKKLVRNTRIHLMPTMNPDGFVRSAVGCMYEMPSRRGRLNANNVDLNRNFPSDVIGTKLDAGVQPETRAVMEWSKQVPFVLSANLHGGAVVAVIPWDSSLNTSTLNKADERKCPDHDTYMELARAYSKSHWTMSDGNICYDKCAEYHPEVFPNDGVTTGSGWYQFYGSMQDWMYTNTNDYHTTLELGCNQYPPAESLIQYWDMNKVALLNYMRQVHRGVKGMVKDASTGTPLAGVNVHVRNIDHNVTSTAAGDYFRLLVPGLYRILFERAGYHSEEIFVTLGDGMAQIHNIKLRSTGQPAQIANNTETSSPTTTTITTSEQPETVLDEQRRGPGDGEAHPVAVATLVMSVVTVLLLLFLAGAYVIQKRRFARSQSVSVEMQPTGRSNSGTGISLPPIKGAQVQSGSSLSTHMQA